MRPRAPILHPCPDRFDQVKRAGDIGVDHVTNVFKVLLEKCATEAMPGIRQQRVDRSIAGQRQQRVDAVERGKVGFDALHLDAEFGEGLLGPAERRVISDDHKVVLASSAAAGRLEADARRRAGDDGKRARRVGGHVERSLRLQAA